MPSTIRPLRPLRLAFLAFGLLLGVERAEASRAAGVLRYKPPDGSAPQPLPVEMESRRRGHQYELTVRFNRAPLGAKCAGHCPPVTLYLDTDSRLSTGLQLGKDAAETGADVAVSLEVEEPREPPQGGAIPQSLKVRVRRFSNTTGPDGELLAELDSRRDGGLVRLKGEVLRLSLDASQWQVPRGAKVRGLYHPPGERALQALMDPLPPAAKPIEVVEPKKVVPAKGHRTRRTHDPD